MPITERQLSQDFGTKYSVLIVLLILLMQSTMGELFYKANLLGIYGSEFLLLISVFIAVLYEMITATIPRAIDLITILLVAIGYLLYSIIWCHREFIWIARQFAVFIYFSTSLLGFWFAIKNHSNLNWNKILIFFGIFGFATTGLHIVAPFSPGHPGYVSYLMSLLGYGAALYRCRGLITNLTFSGIALLLSTFIGSTGFIVAPLAISASIWFLKYPRLRLPLLVTGTLIAITSPFLMSGLRDGNAIWRFIYWFDILQSSYDRGYFLIGNGFGSPFMSEAGDNFERILSQVSGRANRDYQLMTVPPHNGILTFLHLVGIIPVGILIWAFRNMLTTAIRTRHSDYHAIFSTLCGYMIIFVSTQMSVTPYGAIIFWLVFGVTYGLSKSINTHSQLAK